MKTLLFILFPFILSAQMENVMLDVPDPGKGLLQAINYKWNYKKTIGLSVIIIASVADGLREGSEFDGWKSFERKFGVKPISYAGSESWLLAYKDHDVTKGFKSKYREWAGAPDLKHHLDDTRKYGYIVAGACFVIGGISKKDKEGKRSTQSWRAFAIDAIIYSVAASTSKSLAMTWVRS